MIPRNSRIIDPAAIVNNMRLIRNSVPKHVKVMAVVKADGYGHGAVPTAFAAIRGGADMLAVASVGEGIELRDAGINVPILVLGAVTPSDVQNGIEYNLIQTICSAEMVLMCDRAASVLNKQASVHLKVDSGMGRIGVRTEEERDSILKVIQKSRYVKLCGVFTHFSDADGDEDGIRYTQEQFDFFLRMIAPLPDNLIRHCCNSAGIHRYPEMYLDMVRAGISLYGYPPVKTDLKLQPCMSWTAVISYIKELPAGSYISYGRTFRNNRTIRIATVTCAYADGYFRACSNKGYILIHGRKARITGRICMDQLMADITGIDGVSIGDEAVLMGRSGDETITAEDIASWAHTISYEILCSSGKRVDRLYLNTF